MVVLQKDSPLHNKKAKHKRTGVIRTIYVLIDEKDTPGAAALEGRYDPLYNLLYESYIMNNTFWDLLE